MTATEIKNDNPMTATEIKNDNQMTATEINYDKAFQLFTNKDDWRETFHQPFKYKDKYFASDGYGLMFLPVKEAELPYPDTEKTGFAEVIAKEETLNQEIAISVLEEKLIPEMIDEEIENENEEQCDECGGGGEVEFEYIANMKTFYTEADCPVCDGKGVISENTTEITGKKIPNPSQQYRLFDVIFSYAQLSRLLMAVKIIGGQKLIKKFGGKTSGNLFRCGVAGFLIMPIVNKDVPEDTIVLIA